MTETKARNHAVFREEDKRCKPSIPQADHSLPSRFAELAIRITVSEAGDQHTP